MTTDIEKMIADLNAGEPCAVPEGMETLDGLFDDVFKTAEKQLLGTNETSDDPTLTPMWLLLTQNGHLAVVATPFNDDGAGKNAVAALIRKMIAEAHIVRYAFVSEAWLKKLPADTPRSSFPTPSECLDRVEVLMITGADRKSGEAMVTYEIVRDSDGTVIELKRDASKGDIALQSGRFAGLLDVAKH